MYGTKLKIYSVDTETITIGWLATEPTYDYKRHGFIKNHTN